MLLTISPEEAFTQLQKAGKAIHSERRLPLEKIVATSATHSYLYARDILRHRFLEGEAAISKNPNIAYFYACSVVKDRWTIAEKTMSVSPDTAFRYAEDVCKGQFPLGEKAIATHPLYAFKYAKEILKVRWPAGEPAIATDPELSVRYAAEVLNGGRFVEGESAILTSPAVIMDYVERILRRRWKECESVLIGNVKLWSRYCDKYLTEKDKELAIEPDAVVLTPMEAYTVCSRTGPDPLMEKFIAADAHASLMYARHILHGKFPAGEAAILTDAVSCYNYAKDILQRRWIDAEKVIAGNPNAAWGYATWIINGRFPEAESSLKKNEKLWGFYVKKFNLETPLPAEKIPLDGTWKDLLYRYVEAGNPEDHAKICELLGRPFDTHSNLDSVRFRKVLILLIECQGGMRSKTIFNRQTGKYTIKGQIGSNPVTYFQIADKGWRTAFQLIFTLYYENFLSSGAKQCDIS